MTIGSDPIWSVTTAVHHDGGGDLDRCIAVPGAEEEENGAENCENFENVLLEQKMWLIVCDFEQMFPSRYQKAFERLNKRFFVSKMATSVHPELKADFQTNCSNLPTKDRLVVVTPEIKFHFNDSFTHFLVFPYSSVYKKYEPSLGPNYLYSAENYEDKLQRDGQTKYFGSRVQCHHNNRSYRAQRLPNIHDNMSVTLYVDLTRKVGTTNENDLASKEILLSRKMFRWRGTEMDAVTTVANTAHFWSIPVCIGNVHWNFFPGTDLWSSASKLVPFPWPQEEKFESAEISGACTVNRFPGVWFLCIKRMMAYQLRVEDNDVATADFSSKFQQIYSKLQIMEPRYIQKEAVVGEGGFGVISRGLCKGIPVAFKTTRADARQHYCDALLREISVLSYIGRHPNIVTFYGAVLSKFSPKIVHSVMELSPIGDMETFLRRNRWNYQHHINFNELDHIGVENTMIKSSDLAYWCQQIAAAMTHLENKRVTHGDMASRNVLMFDKKIVKICDFGLSTIEEQRIGQISKLPWRWTALEALTRFTFTSKSDVWSFAMTVFEIYTFGAIPYFPMEFCFLPDFPIKLARGLRPAKPEFASDQVYATMLRCWLKEPDRRPSFKDLHDTFQKIRMDLLTQERMEQTNPAKRSKYVPFEDFQKT